MSGPNGSGRLVAVLTAGSVADRGLVHDFGLVEAHGTVLSVEDSHGKGRTVSAAVLFSWWYSLPPVATGLVLK